MRVKNSQHVFLTGGTGVLGARLLKEILETTDAQVSCLVRARSTEEAKQRLYSFLLVYDPEEKLREEFDRRVTLLPGDVTDENFQLDLAAYHDLIARTDFTIHVAAITNLFYNLRRIEPVNVGGTKNVLRFCLQTAQKRFCYVSTYTVMGDKNFDGDFVFRESDLDVGQGFDHMTYQHTKFIAENMVRKAGEQGLRWNIMRPGQIYGEALTGYYPQGQTNVSGLFYDIFKTVIDTKVALISDVHYDVVPVDYVSRAIIHLAMESGRYFETYHLTNPDRKTYSEVIGTIGALGYPMDFVSQDSYRAMLYDRTLFVDGEEYKSFTTKAFKWWFMQSFDFTTSARTDCTYTRDILAQVGIACPKIDLNLIGTYVEAGIEKGYFPTAPRKSKFKPEVHLIQPHMNEPEIRV